MRPTLTHRRSFLKSGSGIAAFSLGRNSGLTTVVQSQPVPWSSGTERPHSRAIANSTDCHHHIYDSRFPVDPTARLRPGDATVQDYRLLQQRIGIERHVVVQPSTYGVDNRCLADALRQFGLASARGVAVVNAEVTDGELKRLDALGVRGIRFNLGAASATSLNLIEPLSHRVAPLNWHIQINASPQVIGAAAGLWRGLPCPVVFDHLAHIREPNDQSPGFSVIRDLLQTGRGWVKLSGAYIDSSVGPPSYSDRAAIAEAYVREAPERLLWGSDWPHPSAKQRPDDAVLFDLLAYWIPDVKTRTRVLVENPAQLYGFS